MTLKIFAARTPCGEPVKPEEPLSRNHLIVNYRAAGARAGWPSEISQIRLSGAR
jgi:hypothetical protein